MYTYIYIYNFLFFFPVYNLNCWICSSLPPCLAGIGWTGGSSRTLSQCIDLLQVNLLVIPMTFLAWLKAVFWECFCTHPDLQSPNYCVETFHLELACLLQKAVGQHVWLLQVFSWPRSYLWSRTLGCLHCVWSII